MDLPDEKIDDNHKCAVCLELAHKPIVLACGHVFCFWCVQRILNPYKASKCPYCLHTLSHFPAICELLHYLLLKMYPVAYRRRANQVSEEEAESGYLSAQLADLSSELVTTNDLLCSACNQLLYQPVVLNCGHVYCQSCIATSVEEAITCEICGCSHPSGFPEVCKVLDHIVSEKFSEEYALRKETGQLTHAHDQEGERQESSSRSSLSVHEEIGCDCCGMYPIIGLRYKCKDCVDKIGYDLCEKCYNNPGEFQVRRFHQNHTADHEFELIDDDLYIDLEDY